MSEEPQPDSASLEARILAYVEQLRKEGKTGGTLELRHGMVIGVDLAGATRASIAIGRVMRDHLAILGVREVDLTQRALELRRIEPKIQNAKRDNDTERQERRQQWKNNRDRHRY